MNNFKKSFVLIFICIIFLCPQKADAGTISNAVDKSINYAGNATYYVTKYTLQTVCFIVKETAKGIKVVSLGILKGTKDAFFSTPKSQKVETVSKPIKIKDDFIYTLPSAPIIK